MNKATIIEKYFYNLEIRSYNELISLFKAGAIIHSPLYGQILASKFYIDLFKDTNNSKITLQNILISENNANIAAAHFIYVWTLKNNETVKFECVDIFEFSNDNQIVSLKIIYDTYPIRNIFNIAINN